jgi:tetratricopeptide (TPR) repeat protein
MHRGFSIIFNFFILFFAYPVYSQSLVQILDEGQRLHSEGKLKEAMERYNFVISRSENYAEAYQKRGWLFNDMKDYSLAIVDFTKATEITPTFSDAYFGRGYAYLKQDNYDAAIKDFNKVIEIQPYAADAFCYRGIAKKKCGKLKEGCDDLYKAMELGDDNAYDYLSDCPE